MAQTKLVKTRRTQAARTAETKAALVEATIRVIHRVGYGGATTALIAEDAGVSRGAILHQFGTRAELMAEVIRDVFARERREYERIEGETHMGHQLSDWPAMLWQVFRQPSGLAVLEILQASRSDPELAERVKATQKAVEELALSGMSRVFGETLPPEALDRMRLVVWAIRGLAIGQVLVDDPEEIGRAVDLFQRVLVAAHEAGVFTVQA